MSKFIHSLMVGTMLVCSSAHAQHSQTMEPLDGDNMVSLPEVPPQVSPEEESAHKAKLEAAKAEKEKADAERAKRALHTPELNEVTVDTDPDDSWLFRPMTGRNYVEAGINHHDVTRNQGDWNGQFLKGEMQTDKDDRWNAIIQHQEAFKENGWYVGAGNTHTWNEKYFTGIGAGFGSGTAIFPRFRVDGDVNRRWLEKGNLVTTLGASFTAAESKYTGYSMFLGASYYFPAPWVVQVGTRIGVSNPGAVISNSQFIALTYGYSKRYYLTGRIGRANEAYQLLCCGRVTNAFNSNNAGLNWRHWLGKDWGYNFGYNWYDNPVYTRNGYTFSVFKEF